MPTLDLPTHNLNSHLMPFAALPLPPAPPAYARGVGVGHGLNIEYVARREQPIERRRDICYDIIDNSTRASEFMAKRFIEDGRRKIERIHPLITKRIQEAVDAGTYPSYTEEFARVFSETMTVFSLNPRFSQLSFSVTEDGELELSRVDEERTRIDYFTLGFDFESRVIVAAFSSISNGKSVFNTFGTLSDVTRQILDSKVI